MPDLELGPGHVRHGKQPPEPIFAPGGKDRLIGAVIAFVIALAVGFLMSPLYGVGQQLACQVITCSTHP